MSRYRGPRTKILRALGVDLPGFTTRSRERRPYPPGQHGQKHRKLSEFAIRVIPSYRVKAGCRLQLKNTEKPLREPRHPSPSWLQVDMTARTAQVSDLPDGKETMFPLDVKLIIEHYSNRL